MTGPGPEPIEVRAGPFTFTGQAAGPAHGRLVLLLHGFPQSASEWRHQLPALAAEGCRAVAFDQRGYCAGARPEGVSNYAVEHLVADVLAVVGDLGGHAVDLVGHDWGAVVAWAFAARYPDRVRTLTAVSVPHPAAFAAALTSDPDQLQRSAYIGLLRREGAAEAALLGNGGAGLRGVFALTGLAEEARDGVEDHVARLSQPGALTAALNWYRAVSLDAAGLGPVAVPTLFVWSDADSAIGRTAAECCAQWVEGPYRFEVLAGVSHWVPEEAPEAFNRLLLAHLAEHPTT